MKPRKRRDEPGGAVGVMADDNGVIAGASGQDATISYAVLDVADDGTFGDGSKGEDVTHHEIGLLPAVDELARVHAFGRNQELLLELVAERVPEGDTGEWGASSRVVDDFRYNALEVAVTLAEVERAEAGGALTMVGVGLEDRSRTLSLGSDHTTHLSPSSQAPAPTKLTEERRGERLFC